MGDDKVPMRPSRRQFLAGAGAAGAGIVAAKMGSAGVMPVLSSEAEADAAVAVRTLAATPGAPKSPNLFGRMFPSLPPFADATDAVRAALSAVGAPEGILDAKDDLAAGPKNLIVQLGVNGNPVNPGEYGTNPDNPTMTAGSTFVGQFTDHDITFDQTSQLGVPQNPLHSPNTRTPALDLDAVFGGGPGLRPDLYVPNPDGTVGPKLLIGTGGVHEDVPRVANGTEPIALCWATHATTRTSSSPASIVRTSCSTTGSSTSSASTTSGCSPPFDSAACRSHTWLFWLPAR